MVLSRYCLVTVSLPCRYCLGTVLVLSRYCLGTVSVLSRYCLSTVALLLRYCRGTVLILSRYCLDTGYCLNTVSVLLRYCLGAVLVLSRYCLDTVAALCRYCLSTVPVLSRYCMDSVSVLPRYYLDTVLVLPWYCLGIVAVLFQCCQGNVLILRGSARYCSFTEILDSWCLLGISWMQTFFWNNYGIVKPVAPISPILFWSWGENHYWEKPISERNVFWHFESCSTSHSSSVNICEKVKTFFTLQELYSGRIYFIQWNSLCLVLVSWYSFQEVDSKSC